MTDSSAVRAAQSAVDARKTVVAAQWLALRRRLRDGLTAPRTLGAVALAGGVLGWRSGAHERPVEVQCNCPDKRSSLSGGGLRALAIVSLQAIASIASEEFIRSTMDKAPRDDGGEIPGSNGS